MTRDSEIDTNTQKNAEKDCRERMQRKNAEKECRERMQKKEKLNEGANVSHCASSGHLFDFTIHSGGGRWCIL